MPNDCGHCGRQRTLETKGQVVLTSETQQIGSGPLLDEVQVERIAEVERCSACGELTLSRYLWIDTYLEADDVDVETLYPPQRAVDDLPTAIRRHYSAMLELQHAPDAFAVRAGRLLEAICADFGISSELSQRNQINALLDEADLPRQLVSQAHLVYTYRNYGGHINELEVEERDVPLIRGFLDSLLDFLYRGPATFERVNAALERRKTEALAPAADGD